MQTQTAILSPPPGRDGGCSRARERPPGVTYSLFTNRGRLTVTAHCAQPSLCSSDVLRSDERGHLCGWTSLFELRCTPWLHTRTKFCKKEMKSARPKRRTATLLSRSDKCLFLFIAIPDHNICSAVIWSDGVSRFVCGQSKTSFFCRFPSTGRMCEGQKKSLRGEQTRLEH